MKFRNLWPVNETRSFSVPSNNGFPAIQLYRVLCGAFLPIAQSKPWNNPSVRELEQERVLVLREWGRHASTHMNS